MIVEALKIAGVEELPVWKALAFYSEGPISHKYYSQKIRRPVRWLGKYTAGRLVGNAYPCFTA